MSATTTNPYCRLKRDFGRFYARAKLPRRKDMFVLKKENLATGYTLEDVWQRTMAAQTLGWSVELEATKDGLQLRYVENLSDEGVPWDIR